MQMERQTQGLLLENTPAAYYRAGRLRVKHANLCQGYFIDICVAIILPSLLGAAIAGISVAVLKNVDGAELWIVENLYSGQVLSSLGTMIVFLVTLRLGDNLARNGKIVGHFGNLTGTCVNMAIWTRSLVSGGNLDYVNYPSGNGGTYNGALVELLRMQGRLAEAEQELGTLVARMRKAAGPQNLFTLEAAAVAAQLRHAQPDGSAAGAAELRAVVERMGEFLGAAHQNTITWQRVLEDLALFA